MTKQRVLGDGLWADDTVRMLQNEIGPPRQFKLGDDEACGVCQHALECRHCPHDEKGRTAGELLRVAAQMPCECWVGSAASAGWESAGWDRR